MLDRMRAWFRGEPQESDPDPRVREALRTGRRTWPASGGGTLELLSTDEELRMTPEQRWTRHNAVAKAAGCKCGKPGMLVREHPVTGSVPFQVYACDEHRDVNTWSAVYDEAGTVRWVPAAGGVA